ncbi:hypothetical protein ABE083_06655 [Bacillus mycoides]|uniref:hypothetical protein n=1 Tax=Bacillus mycoides TaxID=1405 RepID=UPI003D1B8A36
MHAITTPSVSDEPPGNCAYPKILRPSSSKMFGHTHRFKYLSAGHASTPPVLCDLTELSSAKNVCLVVWVRVIPFV